MAEPPETKNKYETQTLLEAARLSTKHPHLSMTELIDLALIDRAQKKNAGPKTKAIPVIHCLRAGVTLCLMPGVPRDWPEGHKWVRKEEEKSVTCRACLEVLKLGTAGEPTFELLEEGLAIKCRRCGMISRNPDDVKNFYCGQCHIFHDDIYPPARGAWVSEPDQKTRLQVAITMLDYCAAVFRAYEDAHRASGKIVKADANMRIAEQVEALVKRLNEP